MVSFHPDRRMNTAAAPAIFDHLLSLADTTRSRTLLLLERHELFGDRFHLAAFAALAERDWVVGDLGCGTGQVSAAIAPFVARVVAVDGSAAMLNAARRRLQGFDNVDLRRGELEALPIDDAR